MHRILLCAALVLAISPAWADTTAVLPFFNYSKAPTLDWIGESVSERVRESLASEGQIALSREERTEIYRRMAVRPNAILTRATVLRIGQAVDAGQVIFGSYELSGADPADPKALANGTIRLTAWAIDLKQTRLGPTFTAEGPMMNLSELQTQIAWQVLRYVAPKGAITEADFKRKHPPVRVDALESYIRGLLAPGDDVKIKLFSQAARLDDQYSQPAFQLGRIYFGKKDYRDASLWFIKVANIDSHYMESQFLLGLCRFYQGDYESAAKQFQLVSATFPLNEVFNNLGAAQSRLNRPEARENFLKALDADTSDPDYWFNAGIGSWKRGDFNDAKERFAAALERNPQDEEAREMLGRVMRVEGYKPNVPGPKERIKTSFEVTAFMTLKALQGK